MVLMHGLAGQKYRNATSRSNGHLRNNAHRVGEHLTQAEIGKLRQARELAFKKNREAWPIDNVPGTRISPAL